MGVSTQVDKWVRESLPEGMFEEGPEGNEKNILKREREPQVQRPRAESVPRGVV